MFVFVFFKPTSLLILFRDINYLGDHYVQYAACNIYIKQLLFGMEISHKDPGIVKTQESKSLNPT